jgi:hypothetical protein
MAVYLGCMVAFFLLTNQIFTLLLFVTQKLKNLRDKQLVCGVYNSFYTPQTSLSPVDTPQT